MSGYGGNSIWGRLDDNNSRRKWIEEQARLRVGNLAESLFRAQHQGQAKELVTSIEAYLYGAAEPRSGDPGE